MKVWRNRKQLAQILWVISNNFKPQVRAASQNQKPQLPEGPGPRLLLALPSMFLVLQMSYVPFHTSGPQGSLRAPVQPSTSLQGCTILKGEASSVSHLWALFTWHCCFWPPAQVPSVPSREQRQDHYHRQIPWILEFLRLKWHDIFIEPMFTLLNTYHSLKIISNINVM